VFLEASFIPEYLITMTAPPVTIFHVFLEFIVVVKVLFAVAAVRVIGTVHIVRQERVPRHEVTVTLPAHPVS